MKTFTPANAGTSKSDIIDDINDYLECYLDDTFTQFTDISDSMCQKYVDDEYDLRFGEDLDEEEFVEKRETLMDKLIAKLPGGKAIIKRLKEERGY